MKSLFTVFIIIVLIIFFRVFIGEFYIITSNSMHPTLQSTEIIFVEKFSYGAILPQRLSEIPILNIVYNIPFFKKEIFLTNNRVRFKGFVSPKKNDVIIFDSHVVKGMHFVKRIIEMRKSGEKIDLNEISVDQIKMVADAEGHEIIDFNKKTLIDNEYPLIYIPKNNIYYVLGDNNKNSIDSRNFGYITEESIIGKALFIVFSWDKNVSGLNKIRWNRILTFIK